MNINKKWNVSKYAWWDYGKNKWQLPVDLINNPTTITLILKGSRILLINKKAAIESLDLIHNSKESILSIFVRNCCMVLVAKCGERYRKFKMLFQTGEDAEDCADCLRKYIKTVVEKPTVQNPKTIFQPHLKGPEKARSTTLQGGRETLPGMLERIMSEAKPSIPAPECIPEDYPFESSVRLCILDPGFPKLVEKVESIINKRYR